MEKTSAEKWERVRGDIARLRKEIGTAVVGQEKIVEQMLVALLCRGHCLVVGVPGLAKTLLVRTLGQLLGLTFRRIQFTPDLMPTDILGSEILQSGEGGASRRFEFVAGPVFANLILADEINRTPPKTQAALLEAMQEKQVTVAGKTRELEEPFIVYATQNPIEHEGTYPLPEAQLDRFFFSLNVDYPSLDEEKKIIVEKTGVAPAKTNHVLTRQDVIELQTIVGQVPIADHVVEHIAKMVHSTRPASPLADEFVKKYVAWGAGPRASQNLTLAAKALALLRGAATASVEEVREVSLPVLRHRVIPNYNATGEGVTAEKIVEHLRSKS